MREIGVILEGRTMAMKQERNERLIQAWHIAALTRAAKMPSLKTLLQDGGERASRRQTPEQIEAVMRSFMASRRRGK